MSKIVEKILTSIGPSLSSAVKHELINNASMNEDNARQIISRARGDVYRLQSLNLPKREKFLYLKSQFGSYDYWENLIKALTTSHSAYGAAFQSITARQFKIPKQHFDIISGSPLRLKKHISSQNILDDLVRTKLLKIEEGTNGEEFVTVDTQGTYIDSYELDLNAYAARSVVEEITANALKDWLRKTGFASYDKVKVKTSTEVPMFGQFQWDITAPSYLYPLVSKTNNSAKPGFVVADHIVASGLTVNQVEYFIRKCTTLRSLKSTSPFLAILLAESFTPEAFSRGKKEGLMFTTPEILFGKEIANALRDLLNTLKNAAAVSVKNPDKIPQLFKKLSSIEGASINLRGALFELIVAHLIHKKEGGSVDIGVHFKDYKNGQKAEVDVRLMQGDHKITIVECKARTHSSSITKLEVEKWIDDRVPLIRKCLLQQEHLRNRELNFEYWTTGQFDDEALSFLQTKKESIRKFDINWKDGKDILKYSQSAQSKSMTSFLKEHYLNHPLNI